MLGSLFKKFFDFYSARRDPVKYARSLGVKIGNDVRLISIKSGSGTFGSEPYLVVIGNHVTVTGGVRFVTHDGGVWVFGCLESKILILRFSALLLLVTMSLLVTELSSFRA